MSKLSNVSRYLHGLTPAHCQRPKVTLQPIQSGEGTASVDLSALADIVNDIAILLPIITIKSSEHWHQQIISLDDSIDAINPVSIPCYPTEIWNSHPQPLVEKGILFLIQKLAIIKSAVFLTVNPFFLSFLKLFANSITIDLPNNSNCSNIPKAFFVLLSQKSDTQYQQCMHSTPTTICSR